MRLSALLPVLLSLAAASAAPVVVTSLAVQLFGVRVDRASGRDGAILSTPDGVQGSYAVGDEIMPGVRLAAVREDGVTLSRNGVREQLFLDQSVPAANAAAAAPGGATGTAGIAPRLLNGTVSGLTVSSPPPALAAAGIRAGDVKPCALVTRLPVADALLVMTNE